MRKWFAVLLFPLVLSGCASTSHEASEEETAEVESIYDALPAQYQVPGLEPLDRVNAFNINGWQVIDRRSLILEAGASRRYLVILRNNSSELRYAQRIGIQNVGSTIRPGFDRIFVEGEAIRMPYYIEAMYEIDGREEVRRVKDYIRNYEAPAEEAS